LGRITTSGPPGWHSYGWVALTVVALGGAYDVMGSKNLGADVNIAWPTAQIAHETSRPPRPTAARMASLRPAATIRPAPMASAT